MNKSDELIKRDRQFSQTSAEKGTVEAYKEFLIENSTFLPNKRDAVFGLPNIVEAIKIPGVTYTLTWEPENGMVSVSNDLGYTWGKYDLSYKNEKGELEVEKGKYLNIWVKENDVWKVSVDMGNIT